MNGEIADMQKLGVTVKKNIFKMGDFIFQIEKLWKHFYIFKKNQQESLRCKEQALISASEAAEMILRVDSIIRCAPRRRERMWNSFF